MQPAGAASGIGAAGIEAGVINLKGKGVREAEYVNSEKFWRKKEEDIPVDQRFFHQYFNAKAARDGPGKSGKDSEDEDSDSDAEQLDAPDGESGSELDEKEIWKAMRKSMPGKEQLANDLGLSDGEDGEDDDDEDLAALDYTDSEDDDDASGDNGEPQVVEGFEEAMAAAAGVAGEDDDIDFSGAESQDFGDITDADEDAEENVFDEDEDDLLPFANFDDLEGKTSGKKRGAEEVEEEEGDGKKGGKELSKSQQKRALKKQRKEMPVFASADDYAHMLGSDDEDA